MVRKLKTTGADSAGARNFPFTRGNSGGKVSGAGTGAENLGGISGPPGWSPGLLRNLKFAISGGKTQPKTSNRWGQMMELGYGNAEKGRSTSFARDLWMKTYQNASNFQIGPKYEIGQYNFWYFRNLWGKKEIKEKFMAT